MLETSKNRQMEKRREKKNVHRDYGSWLLCSCSKLPRAICKVFYFCLLNAYDKHLHTCSSRLWLLYAFVVWALIFCWIPSLMASIWTSSSATGCSEIIRVDPQRQVHIKCFMNVLGLGFKILGLGSGLGFEMFEILGLRGVGKGLGN